MIHPSIRDILLSKLISGEREKETGILPCRSGRTEPELCPDDRDFYRRPEKDFEEERGEEGFLGSVSAAHKSSLGFMCMPSIADEEATEVKMRRFDSSGSLRYGFDSSKDFVCMAYYTT